MNKSCNLLNDLIINKNIHVKNKKKTKKRKIEKKKICDMSNRDFESIDLNFSN